MARPKKPTSLKIIAGTDRKDRDIPLDEQLQFETFDVVPPPPSHFENVAVLVWEDLARQLTDAGLLQKTDLYTLEMLCLAIRRVRELEDLIDEHGELITGSTGSLVANPAMGMQAKAMDQVRMFSARFGLDPAARATISVGKKDKKESLGSILSAPSRQ